MKIFKWILPLLLLSSVSAFADSYTYVGSWEVSQGPDWQGHPTAYSGQQAAALLFGGSASDYVISIAPDSISFTNWVSIIYVGTGTVADDFVQSTDGLYLNPGDTSAYVLDNAIGSYYTNYAWRLDSSPTPEPGSLLLLGTGLVGLAGVLRRRFAK